jgi:putative methyltransferase (TIGR04325 family)
MRETIKRLIGFLLALYRAFRETSYQMRSPFSGVYERWEDVPKVGDDFEGDEWAATARAYSSATISQNESAFIPVAVSGANALLPLIASISPTPLRILDWGGATGFSYIATKYGALDRIEKFVVVEHPKVCAEGRALFNDPRLQFVLTIPRELFDLVLIGASLQYAENYKDLLSELAGPKWFLFIKLPAGENVTFVTCQINIPGKRHQHWLFNVREIVAIMKDLGYRLVFRSAWETELTQSNFDPQYRVGRPCNLLFEKSA